MPAAVFVIAMSLVLITTSAFDERLCQLLFNPMSLECCVAPRTMIRHTVQLVPIDHCDNLENLSCEYESCVAEAYGFAGKNGTFNATALNKIMTEHYRTMPNISKLIRDECIYGNLDSFGEFCDVIRVKHCIFQKLVKACPKWDTSTERCTHMGLLAKKCNHEDVNEALYPEFFNNLPKVK